MIKFCQRRFKFQWTKINLKFLDQPIDQLEIQSEKSLLDMGSCGLHSVHGAFQNGNKNAKWNVNTAL